MEIQIVTKGLHFIFQYRKKKKILFLMEAYNNTMQLKGNKKELNNLVVGLMDKENIPLCLHICLMITDM